MTRQCLLGLLCNAYHQDMLCYCQMQSHPHHKIVPTRIPSNLCPVRDEFLIALFWHLVICPLTYPLANPHHIPIILLPILLHTHHITTHPSNHSSISKNLPTHSHNIPIHLPCRSSYQYTTSHTYLPTIYPSTPCISTHSLYTKSHTHLPTLYPHTDNIPNIHVNPYTDNIATHHIYQLCLIHTYPLHTIHQPN